MAADRDPGPALQSLLRRRSVTPRRLVAPGADAQALAQVVRAALRSPDHGGLTPWRVIEIETAHRGALAELFAQEKRRRDPLASDEDLARAREHATRAPTLLAFVVSIRTGTTVPVAEQWLAAGAALGNLLNGFAALGYGAIVLSGDRCADAALKRALGLQPGEVLGGFISAGTVVQLPSRAADKPLERVWSRWQGEPIAGPQASDGSGASATSPPRPRR